jgi:hypothetical protein
LSVRPGFAGAKRDQFRQAVMKGSDFNTNAEYIILNHESQQFSNVQRTGIIGSRRARREISGGFVANRSHLQSES